MKICGPCVPSSILAYDALSMEEPQIILCEGQGNADFNVGAVFSEIFRPDAISAAYRPNGVLNSSLAGIVLPY